jgi:hypothetical protein
MIAKEVSRASREESFSDQIGYHATKLSIIEVTLGSILHASHIPFSGHALSINQGAVLTHAASKMEQNRFQACFIISTISAVLKSLSPAGKKLGPMLSISVQGFLYSLGIGLFGYNSLGVFIGMALLSLWAFVQPFITFYLFFGKTMMEGMTYALSKIQKIFGLPIDTQIEIFIGIIALKALIAGFIGLYFYRRSQKENLFETLPFWMRGKVSLPIQKEISTIQVIGLALKDLFKPAFLISMMAMMVFFYFSRHELAETIWYALRPLSIAFLFFFISRHPLFYQFLRKSQMEKRFPIFSSAFKKTIANLRNK